MIAANINTLAAVIRNRVETGAGRLIVALAGPPGSGKSTVADALCDALNNGRQLASILPMDGYHYDDGLLKQMQRLAFKGAPDTFDVSGYAHTLRRLRTNDEAQVAVPVFDRSLEISRGSARMISRGIPVILTEGNYLLLNVAPWNELRPLFDITVKIFTPPETLQARLEARWRGFGLPEAEVLRKTEDNDLPNARFVQAHSGPSDFQLLT